MMTNFPKPFSRDSITEINRLESALAAAGIGSWELDLNNNQFWLCERAKSLFDFSGKDIVPYNELLLSVHADDRQATELSIKNALESASSGIFEIDLRIRNSGSVQPHWLHWKGQAYFDDYGAPIRFSGIVQNATSQVLAKKQLYESENKLRSLIDNTPDVITRWNTNLELIFANTAFEEKTGTDNASLLGKTNQQMGQPENTAMAYMKCLQTVIDTRMPQEHYNSFQTSKGEIYFYSRLVPELGDNGQVQSVLAIARDITDLRSSEARFQTMVEQSPMAIGLFNSREMIVEVGNDKIFEVWGKDKSIIGQRLLEALPEIEGQGYLELLQGVYDTGTPFLAMKCW